MLYIIYQETSLKVYFFPVILPYFDELWTFSYIVSVEFIGAVSLAFITEAFPFLLKQLTDI